MTPDELIKRADLQRIATKGAVIYEEVKEKYENHHTGKFLAIDIDSKDMYLAATSAEAVMSAKKDHPENVFYVVKVGFDAAETLARFSLVN